MFPAICHRWLKPPALWHDPYRVPKSLTMHIIISPTGEGRIDGGFNRRMFFAGEVLAANNRA